MASASRWSLTRTSKSASRKFAKLAT
jgi:hypothetical protein